MDRFQFEEAPQSVFHRKGSELYQGNKNNISSLTLSNLIIDNWFETERGLSSIEHNSSILRIKSLEVSRKPIELENLILMRARKNMGWVMKTG